MPEIAPTIYSNLQKSPSLAFNLAMLESFQHAARNIKEIPPDFHDQHDVIIFGGSFGKGTGQF